MADVVMQHRYACSPDCALTPTPPFPFRHGKIIRFQTKNESISLPFPFQCGKIEGWGEITQTEIAWNSIFRLAEASHGNWTGPRRRLRRSFLSPPKKRLEPGCSPFSEARWIPLFFTHWRNTSGSLIITSERGNT